MSIAIHPLETMHLRAWEGSCGGHYGLQIAAQLIGYPAQNWDAEAHKFHDVRLAWPTVVLTLDS